METSRWSWLDDAIQTRSPTFLDDIQHGPLGNSWLFLCEESVLNSPGEFYTDELACRMVIVCRNKQNELKGYFNVCRHLGAPVERNRWGKLRNFTCPYHGWGYSLDGDLLAVPIAEGYENTPFKRESFSMLPVSAISVGGLVFGSIYPPDKDEFFGKSGEVIGEMFSGSSQWSIIYETKQLVEKGFLHWLGDARKVYLNGTIFPYLTDNASNIEHSEWRSGAGHVGVKIKRDGQWRQTLFIYPNLILAEVDEGVVAVRADPLDSQRSILRVQGYGKRNRPETHGATKARLQALWAPLSPHFYTLNA